MTKVVATLLTYLVSSTTQITTYEINSDIIPLGSVNLDDTMTGVTYEYYMSDADYRGLPVYGSGGELHTIPYELDEEQDEHVNSDLLAIYMSVIYQEPGEQFDSWSDDNWGELLKQRNLWVEELLSIYSQGSRSSMVAWFLEYEGLVATMFPAKLPPGVNFNSGRTFVLPKLIGNSYTYMPIRLITSPSSYQYKFKQHLETNEEGFLMYGNAYAIALATHFGITIGGIYEVEFENNEIIYAVLGDVKRDSETDSENKFHPQIKNGVKDFTRGNIIEFIMDDSAWANQSYSVKSSAVNSVIKNRFQYPPIRITFIGVSEYSTVR